MAGKREEHMEAVRELGEDDLVFQVALSGGDARRFYLVDNVGRVDFLRLLQIFVDQKGENRSPEQFLKGHGVHLDLWRDSEDPKRNADMPDFYDVLYIDGEHIVDASRLSTLIQAELMISRAQYGHTALGRETHNLAVRHAYKLDNLKKTKKFIVDMVHAAENPETGNMQEIMESAQAEIDALPDNKVGILQMHEFGFREDSVLPLTMERAAVLHRAGIPIYHLHKDGSASLMDAETDILKAQGMFGIEAAVWEGYLAVESSRGEIEKRKMQDLEKETYPPLYTHTFSYAMDHGETDDYHASGKLNWECKQAVQDAIQEKYDGKHLSHDAADSVLEEYGAERVAFILANTVRHLEHDGRFSKDTKKWAKNFEIPEDVGHGIDLNAKYTVTSHPAVLDGFIGLARKNMQEQEIRQEAVLENAQTRTGPSITFYAAEYAVMPVLGEYHEGLPTLEEAMDLYEKIPAGRTNGMKGIGFSLKDGSDYEGRCELMTADRLQKEFINVIPHYRDSPLVQKAIADMEAILAERTGGQKENPEKETEPPLSVTAQKKEGINSPISAVDKPETKKTEMAAHKPEPVGNDGQTAKKAAGPEKMVETTLKTDRDISGVSIKLSVLNALRERQAKLKAQEKQVQKEHKPRAHGKGGPEL